MFNVFIKNVYTEKKTQMLMELFVILQNDQME
jgi:hypothetical protein